MKATCRAEAIFLDAGGAELHRSVFEDARTLVRAMTDALAKYQPRQVTWMKSLPAASAKPVQRMMVVAFVDSRRDSKSTLKAFEDPRVAKLHGEFLFVRRSFIRGSKEMRQWEVFSAPTLMAVELSGRRVVNRVVGTQKPWEIMEFLKKALEVADEKQETKE